MNYRHIYHAGNLCDVVKHITLLSLLDCLKQKPAPLLVLDTHAGCGLYDLTEAAAGKTGEAERGVRALLRAGGAPASYQAALVAVNPDGLAGNDVPRFYPGSPCLLTAALRPQDRYVGCELHPEDFVTLRRNLRHMPLAQLHQRDGYEALLAFTPPPEKRGLVLIDPPFEQAGEFERLVKVLTAAHRHWATGVYAVWYPLKDQAGVARWQAAMAATGIRKQLLLEFIYDEAGHGLYGSGLLVINPPWQWDAAMAETYAVLHQALGLPVAETKIAWLVGE